MCDEKRNARPAGSTAGQAKRESHWTSGDPYRDDITGRGGGQGTVSCFLMEGAQNGLHLRDLVCLIGEDQRTVRKMIHEERRRGIPILSDNKSGYFLPSNDTEKDACVRSMRHRAREIERAAEAIERVKG